VAGGVFLSTPHHQGIKTGLKKRRFAPESKPVRVREKNHVSAYIPKALIFYEILPPRVVLSLEDEQGDDAGGGLLSWPKFTAVFAQSRLSLRLSNAKY